MKKIILKDSNVLKHPFYQLMQLNESELKKTLKKWSRLDCLRWLKWNDKNGIYLDDECKKEGIEILKKSEAIEIIINQIIQE
jgi:hypothetical protein